jgi:hypothetical protein
MTQGDQMPNITTPQTRGAGNGGKLTAPHGYQGKGVHKICKITGTECFDCPLSDCVKQKNYGDK